jgi:hypothetical protein
MPRMRFDHVRVVNPIRDSVRDERWANDPFPDSCPRRSSNCISCRRCAARTTSFPQRETSPSVSATLSPNFPPEAAPPDQS